MVCQRPITLINVPSQYGTGKVAHGSAWRTRTDYLRDYLKNSGLTLTDVQTIQPTVGSEPGEENCKWLPQVTAVNQALYSIVTEALNNQSVPIVIGGDHSLAIASVTATAHFMAALNQHPTLLWVDAHIDMNTPATTPSGNIHGMALAALCGLMPHLAVGSATVQAPLIPAHSISALGIRFTDIAERPNIGKAALSPITMDQIDNAGIVSILENQVSPLLLNSAGVHLSFDLDALDPSVAPSVNTPAPGGLTFREARQICEAVAYSGKLVTMDLVEHDADAGREEVMLPLMGELIATALGASNMSTATDWKELPG